MFPVDTNADKEGFIMLMPSIYTNNLFDDWFDFPDYHDLERRLYGKHAAREMKTDVREQDDHYEIDIDLPGFKKDELNLALQDGYLTIQASKGYDNEQKDEGGRTLRQERYTGSMQRSFYVGDAVTEEDVSARFADGVLSLKIPKKEAAVLPDKKPILIEG